MIDVDIVINTQSLERLESSLVPALHGALKKTAFFIEAHAKRHAPVDTGAYKSSIFVVMQGTSTYAAAATAARSRATARGKRINLHPSPGIPVSPWEAIIAVGVEYGAAVEYGAFHKRGNTKRLGERSGRIGVTLDSGGFATYQAGYLIMNDAARAGRIFLAAEVRKAFASLVSSR